MNTTRSRLFARNCDLSGNKQVNVVILDINAPGFISANAHFQVKQFNEEEIDAWFDCVTSSAENMHLFVSNIIDDTIIQVISQNTDINSIYIHHKSDNNSNYTNNNKKLKGVFDAIGTMFKKFEEETKTNEYRHRSEQKTFQEVDRDNSAVLWWRSFEEMLKMSQLGKAAKDEFVEFSKQNFSENETALRQIHEFATHYEPTKAIEWYTRESFLYRLVNNTLRNRKALNDVFKMRLIIRDIVQQLSSIQLHYRKKDIDSLTVYRGQCIGLSEVQHMQLSIGKVFCCNQFLSTSRSLQVAEMYATQGSALDVLSGSCSVIFIISCDLRNTDSLLVPFADISPFSSFVEESEVLFSVHSTFLIESVELLESNLWRVHLKLVNVPWDVYFGERSVFSPHADQIFTRNLSKESKQFVAFEVLLDMLLRLEQTEYGREELVEFCGHQYFHNPVELRNIRYFEANYNSVNAAKWFTKSSFLYRLLHKSLRSETVDHIAKMRYYIHDLHNHLAQMQPAYIASLNGKRFLRLFRGQLMKIDLLNEIRANIGGLISMNSFLSTTENESVALLFSGNGETSNTNEVSVIYEMKIDTNIRSTPYAKIESFIADEEEVLFSIGAVFRIDDVVEINKKLYRVHLTMAHVEDQLWNKLTDHLKYIAH